MKLTDGSTTFTITIQGYQFPSHTERYDANWLMIQFDVERGDARSSIVDPAFLTWEVERLVAWLLAIARGDPVEAQSFTFMDVPLKLELLSERSVLRVTGMSYVPSVLAVLDDEPVVLEVPAESGALAGCASSLHAQLMRFPRR